MTRISLSLELLMLLAGLISWSEAEEGMNTGDFTPYDEKTMRMWQGFNTFSGEPLVVDRVTATEQEQQQGTPSSDEAIFRRGPNGWDPIFGPYEREVKRDGRFYRIKSKRNDRLNSTELLPDIPNLDMSGIDLDTYFTETVPDLPEDLLDGNSTMPKNLETRSTLSSRSCPARVRSHLECFTEYTEYLKSEEKSSGVSASATIKKVSIDGGFQTGRMTSSEFSKYAVTCIAEGRAIEQAAHEPDARSWYNKAGCGKDQDKSKCYGDRYISNFRKSRVLKAHISLKSNTKGDEQTIKNSMEVSFGIPSVFSIDVKKERTANVEQLSKYGQVFLDIIENPDNVQKRSDQPSHQKRQENGQLQPADRAFDTFWTKFESFSNNPCEFQIRSHAILDKYDRLQGLPTSDELDYRPVRHLAIPLLKRLIQLQELKTLLNTKSRLNEEEKEDVVTEVENLVKEGETWVDDVAKNPDPNFAKDKRQKVYQAIDTFTKNQLPNLQSIQLVFDNGNNASFPITEHCQHLYSLEYQLEAFTIPAGERCAVYPGSECQEPASAILTGPVTTLGHDQKSIRCGMPVKTPEEKEREAYKKVRELLKELRESGIFDRKELSPYLEQEDKILGLHFPERDYEKTAKRFNELKGKLCNGPTAIWVGRMDRPRHCD